jgi:hypothetical protein
VLQVTNVTEQTLVVAPLASAAKASSCWDLRCDVREKLVAYLRREHPRGVLAWAKRRDGTATGRM